MLDGSGRPFFALIIAIDTYKDKNISGCVADADDIQAFLTKDLHISPDRIVNLRNKKATYASIIQEIRKFAADDRVAFNSPILIYFAGCCGEVQGSSVLFPYDSSAIGNSKFGNVLSETKLNGHLKQLANLKGNNIVRWSIMCFFFSPNIIFLRLRSLTYVMLAFVERAMYMRPRTPMFC